MRMFGRFSKFKGSKGWKDYRYWTNGVNLKKSWRLLQNATKEVPKELLEEGLQTWTAGLVHAHYNRYNGSKFSMPTAEDYKAVRILTPLAVLGAGGIRTRGFRKGGVSNEMLQQAIENPREFQEIMQKAVADGNMGEELNWRENKEYGDIMADLQGYVVAKNSIPIEEYNEMDPRQRQETLNLLVKKEQLKSKLKQEKDPKEIERLKKDLKNTESELKKVASSIQTEYVSRQEQVLDLDILADKIAWRQAERGSQERKDLAKKLKDKIKERNELRDKAPLYEFNGKSYNNGWDFQKALKEAKDNGYFDKPGVRPKIRISNKVPAERAKYLVDLANKLSGNKIFKSGEVLMSSADVAEQNEFANQPENRGKTIEDYKKDYKKE